MKASVRKGWLLTESQMPVKKPAVDLGLMEGGFLVISLKVSWMEVRLARMGSPLAETSQ